MRILARKSILQPAGLLCTAALFLVLAGCGGSVQARTDEASRLAAILDLRPGAHLADVGAGDGEWSEKLAPFIAPDGHIYATEVKDDEIEKIETRIARAGLENVSAVRGDQRRTGLDPGCCDAILLRMVYHHFTDPASMRADLKRALHPRGLIAIVEIKPQKDWRELPDTPDRGGHGIAVDTLIEEMTSDGFAVVAKYDDWNDDEERYCVVFRR